jgi:putative ABC transport system permease protein
LANSESASFCNIAAIKRLFAKLVTLFGLLAQQLASIGLFGVLAYAVSQRTHEIGIRMALGASPTDVLKMIVRQGMALSLIGVALGLGGAYALTKRLESRMQFTKCSTASNRMIQ